MFCKAAVWKYILSNVGLPEQGGIAALSTVTITAFINGYAVNFLLCCQFSFFASWLGLPAGWICYAWRVVHDDVFCMTSRLVTQLLEAPRQVVNGTMQTLVIRLCVCVLIQCPANVTYHYG